MKQTIHTIIIMILANLVILSGSKSHARVPLWTTQKLSLPDAPANDNSFSTEASQVLPKKVDRDAEGRPLESGATFFGKMIDNSISVWWANTPLRQTSFGRAAESIEKKTQLNAEYKDRHEVRHTFDFKVLAGQALARLEYSGFFKAAFDYDLKSSQVVAEVTEQVAQHQSIVLSHRLSATEKVSKVGYNWSW